MSIQIIQANALDLPLADESVDLVVTSPPYFALRSYQDGGEHYDGQLGDEPTPAEFVDALVAATAEMVRVIKPSGSIWVNLGDKYAQNAGQWQGSRRGHRGALKGTKADRASQWGQGAWSEAPEMGRPKSLIGIPWRYAIRCIDDLELILRAEVIWSKPNGLPESVTDRVRRSHETWFHFTKSPRYFSAVDEIREPHVNGERGLSYDERKAIGMFRGLPAVTGARHSDLVGIDNAKAGHPLGKLPGSVWTIATQPLIVPAELGIDHFAAFPMEWPRRIIQGWSPSGVCVECGEGRRPVAGKTPEWEAYKREHGIGDYLAGNYVEGVGYDPGAGRQRSTTKVPIPSGPKTIITGYACACDEPTAETTPAVVLDPFGGTGTTALVADVLGRDAIHVDLSADYCRLARWRTTDPGERARAEQRPKPKTTPVHPEQGTLI